VLVKTGFLYAIMVTGAIWEKVVFGRYLFARPFFWEDVVSMAVIALHTAYVAAWLFELLPAREQMWLALCAYVAYVINAAQFLFKFRMARLGAREPEMAYPELAEVRL
jgi:3-vinyl bacteriochlorophyllide hydratase